MLALSHINLFQARIFRAFVLHLHAIDLSTQLPWAVGAEIHHIIPVLANQLLT